MDMPSKTFTNKVTEIDGETQEVLEREATVEEITAKELLAEEIAIHETIVESRKAQKDTLLERLGITEEEAQLLLG